MAKGTDWDQVCVRWVPVVVVSYLFVPIGWKDGRKEGIRNGRKEGDTAEDGGSEGGRGRKRVAVQESRLTGTKEARQAHTHNSNSILDTRTTRYLMPERDRRGRWWGPRLLFSPLSACHGRTRSRCCSRSRSRSRSWSPALFVCPGKTSQGRKARPCENDRTLFQLVAHLGASHTPRPPSAVAMVFPLASLTLPPRPPTRC